MLEAIQYNITEGVKSLGTTGNMAGGVESLALSNSNNVVVAQGSEKELKGFDYVSQSELFLQRFVR